MKRFSRIISTALCISTLISISPTIVSAKSLSWVGREMEYRKKLINEPEFKTYVKTSPEYYVYYGAKFEPRAGVYVGTPYDRTYPGVKNSINTWYDWFVPSDDIKNENLQRKEIAETPSDHTKLIGLNWNFALPNSKVIEITDYTNYIYNRIDEIASWGMDVLLIFGKEMNIDDNFNDPELFKRCFRFVADYTHTKENIAMVWAPNDTGGLDTTLLEFYPGDEYVDWIGCSLYTMPYFQGNPNNNDAAQMSFIMGDYANPSIRAKMIHAFMQENNIKKPVMITEGGVGFESPAGEDFTEWAKQQLRMYYADIYRIYPEFKCIISFNQYVNGDLYRYDMMNNPELKSIIDEVLEDPIYLKDYPSSAPYAHTELIDGMVFTDKIEVTSYAYRPKKQNLVVRYLIDGVWVSEKSTPPYEISLDNSYVAYGNHTLTCEIYDGEKIAARKDYKISLIPTDDKSQYADDADNGKCRFKDMADAPSEMRNAVALLNEKGIVNGVDSENFAPYNRVSRAEIATMLSRLAKAEKSDKPCGFSDVSKSDWYYDTVNSAVTAGLISGYDDNTFRGNSNTTKNEFIAIAARILNNKGFTNSESELNYSDGVADWVKDYVKTTKSAGVLLERSDGIFHGNGTISRGDAAIMMARLYNKLNG